MEYGAKLYYDLGLASREKSGDPEGLDLGQRAMVWRFATCPMPAVCRLSVIRRENPGLRRGQVRSGSICHQAQNERMHRISGKGESWPYRYVPNVPSGAADAGSSIVPDEERRRLV